GAARQRAGRAIRRGRRRLASNLQHGRVFRLYAGWGRAESRARSVVDFLKRHWYALNAVALLVIAAFAYGVAVGTFRLPPYELLQTAVAGVQDWAQHPRHNARMTPEKFLYPLA